MAVEETKTNETTQNTTGDASADLKIVIDEHEKFDAIVDEKYLTSKDFCEAVSQIFHTVFADFEGCSLDPIPNSNQVAIGLYFNHRDYSGSDMPVACSRYVDNNNTKNATLRSIRARNNMLTHGDRFYLTKDGQSAISDLLINGSFLYKNDGTVRWDKCVAEITDPSTQFGYGVNKIQLTKVSYVDPIKLAALIYGDTEVDPKDGTETHWVYNIRVLKSLPNIVGVGQSNNFMLAVERISTEETEKLANAYGFTFSSGLNIIR